MRYKVGDKVKVRSDLKENIRYGGQIFVRDMAVHCGKNVEISKVYDDAYCIKESDREWFWTDEMFEPVDKMSAAEVIRILGELCNNTPCRSCPVRKLDERLMCTEIRIKYSKEVVDILEQWKKDHEKKEIEVELAYVVRVIEDTGEVKRCVYEEDVTEEKGEKIGIVMKRILEEYCMEHEGKFFIVYEEICRVKE